MNFKKLLHTVLKIVLPLAFGCLLLWFLYRKVNLDELLRVIQKGVRYDIILFSLLFGLGGNIVRGLRWSLLIESLGEKFKKKNAVLAVVGNYAVNLILPRVGEVWRCGVLTKYDKISFPKLFGTLLIDRVCDTIMVGLTTLLVFTFNIGFFTRFFADNPSLLMGFHSFFHSVWTYVLFTGTILLTWIAFTYWTHLFLIRKAKEVLASIWGGMKSIWLMKNKMHFLLLTLLLWLGYFCFFYITFYAFDFTHDLGIRVGLIGFTMSSIAVAVPVQGGIGPWHFMVIATLVCFGVNRTDAAAFALIVWTIQTVWIALVGTAAIVLLPLVNKKTSAAASK
ncbi:lysylphosphatidylglycerol synthase transmembrane domain-containing protein [Parabacteroides sp. Marseille-P3160]|uniref:lysylphosphatidylglycerol synthase transmembrane domain-containing protein n=1 Tax=Parabacteroides sp. Marseille-P3160 TaxID=1917887 RepID=UPI0009BBA848|nr:lysylphosphatidylglycerol synthase transmembrane domain-containing protein [Parabacteroides sp. Marseille-P3160]